MPSRADSVPLDHEILCGACGYSLTGLAGDGMPAGARCPECGEPAERSLHLDGRGPTPWEAPGLPGRVRLWRTWWGVVRHPGQFFRGMLARASPNQSAVFGFVMHFAAAYGFAVAVAFHAMFVDGGRYDVASAVFLSLLGAAVLTPVLLAVIYALHRLVSYLSWLEARYYGYRLPEATVRRGLHYHAALLPLVAAVMAGYTGGYRLLLAWDLLPRTDTELAYLYGLCGLVVVSAGYLFWTYWLAMKGLRYANR
ncbi:MAG: hypothetical protein ACK4PI_06350 [Tepidisphaerales bacterium]